MEVKVSVWTASQAHRLGLLLEQFEKEVAPPLAGSGQNAPAQGVTAALAELTPAAKAQLVATDAPAITTPAVALVKDALKPAKPATAAALTTAMKTYLETHTLPDALAILGKFGVTQVSKVKPEDRAAVIEALA